MMVRLHGGSHNVRALARGCGYWIMGWLLGTNDFTVLLGSGLTPAADPGSSFGVGLLGDVSGERLSRFGMKYYQIASHWELAKMRGNG
jgi:hypothetical protein